MNENDKKFQMKYDYKTKINMNLSEWQELFSNFNETHGDEKVLFQKIILFSLLIVIPINYPLIYKKTCQILIFLIS